MSVVLDKNASPEVSEDLKVGNAQEETARYSPPYSDRFAKGGAWPTIIWLGLIHVGALAAPFFFSWEGLAVAIVLYFLSGCVGITLGFHRYLTHAGFKTYKPMRWTLAFIGGLAGEGSAIDWVADHRKHHAHSDQEGDPHSPLDGGWWAHLVWLFPYHSSEDKAEMHKRWAPDLLKDPGLVFLHKTFIVWHILLGLALGVAGYMIGGGYMAASLVVWGMFLRLAVLLHVTWFVNSATHMWGYRNYDTTDKSTNLWWVGLLAFGEGWHNNHHAYPRMAVHGHKWWEFDLTWNVIRVMKIFGLAWDVVDYKQRTRDGSIKV